MNLFDLKDRVVVMTGATGVLGKSISTYFACQGAKVVILVRERSAEKGEALAAEIRALGGEAASYVADVMSKSSLEAAYEAIMGKYGRVDVLMNAAGGNMPAATVAPEIRMQSRQFRTSIFSERSSRQWSLQRLWPSRRADLSSILPASRRSVL